MQIRPGPSHHFALSLTHGGEVNGPVPGGDAEFPAATEIGRDFGAVDDVLAGRPAMFGHEPPTYLRSITATRFPCWARVHAANFDPAPLPRTTRSYSSGVALLKWPG